MGYENAHTTGIWQEIEHTQNFLSLLPAKPKAGTMTNDKKAAGSPSAKALTDAPARIEILLVGMNGDLRGSRLRRKARRRSGTVRCACLSSTQSLDIWGDDNDDITGLSLSVGDPDGVCIPDRRSLTVLPWAPEGSRQVLATMHEFDGTASFHGPARHSRAHADAFRGQGPDTGRRDGA